MQESDSLAQDSLTQDSLTQDSLTQAQTRLNDAMQAVHAKISDQQAHIQHLSDENSHLKQLLETQAESLSVLSTQKQDQSQKDNDAEKQALIRDIEALKSEKKMIKERLDRTIAALEAQVTETSLAAAPATTTATDTLAPRAEDHPHQEIGE